MSTRRHVERVERVVLGTLSPSQRGRLTERLHELWSGYFLGLSREDFARTHLFDQTRLVMSFGPAGDLAGFANINPHVLRAGGREHLVLTSGLFNRLEYRSSRGLQLGCVREALKLVAAHRGVPVAGVAVATSPVSYNLAARRIPRFYPHPAREAPPEVLPLLHELARVRGLPIDPANPWVTQFPVRVADAERIQRSRMKAQGSPWISWYEERVPDWAAGRAMPLWVPIDAKNALGVLWNLLRDRRVRGRDAGA